MESHLEHEVKVRPSCVPVPDLPFAGLVTLGKLLPFWKLKFPPFKMGIIAGLWGLELTHMARRMEVSKHSSDYYHYFSLWHRRDWSGH